MKSKVVYFARRREWHNWLWFPKVPVAGERGMVWRWEDQMWAYSLDSCPVIQVDGRGPRGGDDAQEEMATCRDFSM